MAFEPLVVMVNGRPVRLVRGATVKHALYSAAGDASLVRLVESGKARVWDETHGAETDLGGALYPGQRLTVREAAGS